MITLNQLPSSRFLISLAKDIDALGRRSSEFKFLTVSNVSTLNHAAELANAVEVLKQYIERCNLWRNSGDKDTDLLYDLGLNLCNITRDADMPGDDTTTDVREMLDHEKLSAVLDDLIAIITVCEFYPRSTIYNLMLMNALSVMWMLYSTVSTAAEFFETQCDSKQYITKFLGQYDVIKTSSDEEYKQDAEYGLKFTRHDKQIVFSDEEKRAIAEAEQQAAEEERKVAETCKVIKETAVLHKLLTSIVGDKVGDCKSIDDCKRINALASLLKSIYVFTINAGMVDDETAIKGGWELLSTHKNEKPGDSLVGMFQIGKLTPYSIAYWLNKLFGSKFEASFVTSMEVITLDTNEVYHYGATSMVTVCHTV